MIFKRAFDWDDALAEVLPRDFARPLTGVAELAEYILAPDHYQDMVTSKEADECPILMAQWVIREAAQCKGDYEFPMTLQGWILAVPEVQQAARLMSIPGTTLADDIAFHGRLMAAGRIWR